MNEWTIKAHRLAQRIEWIHAKHVREQQGRMKQSVESIYDPLAATVLADLILQTMRPEAVPQP